MTKTSTAVSACVLFAGGILVASGQDATLRPGEPTQARVWVQNRRGDEAVPVAIVQGNSADTAVRVQVAGVPTVTTAPGSLVQARLVRQLWEYREVRVPT